MKVLYKTIMFLTLLIFCVGSVCAVEPDNNTTSDNISITNTTSVDNANIIDVENETMMNQTIKSDVNIIEDNLGFMGFSNNTVDHIENNNSVVDKYGEITHENVDWFNEVDRESDVIALENGLPLTVATIGVAAIGTACGGPVGGVATTGIFLLMVTLTQILNFI